MDLPEIISFLDFEASSLINGYPTQVSICDFDIQTYEMSFYTKFIKPKQAWLDFMDWDKASEKIHGKAVGFLLKNGEDAELVSSEIQESYLHQPLFVDAPDYDGFWMCVLMDADHIRDLPLDILHINEVLIENFTQEDLDSGRKYQKLYKKPAHDAQNDVFNHAVLLKGMLISKKAREG